MPLSRFRGTAAPAALITEPVPWHLGASLMVVSLMLSCRGGARPVGILGPGQLTAQLSQQLLCCRSPVHRAQHLVFCHQQRFYVTVIGAAGAQGGDLPDGFLAGGPVRPGIGAGQQAPVDPCGDDGAVVGPGHQ